jgi:hypothetical protein
MARGFVWAVYQSDDGNSYAKRVDADYAAQPSRGWTYPAPVGTPVYPRGWRARRVVGLDPNGYPRQALVGSTAAGLWTGATPTFSIEGSDGVAYSCVVVRMMAESFGSRPL